MGCWMYHNPQCNFSKGNSWGFLINIWDWDYFIQLLGFLGGWFYSLALFIVDNSHHTLHTQSSIIML